MTAPERHAQVVRAAVQAFAAGGYAGATTEDVARLAGVSQPYVIRIFGTKQALFLAAVEHACDRIEDRFRAAAARDPSLHELGESFHELLGQRELLLTLLHGYAASDDPTIGPVVRRRFGGVYDLVRELSGSDAPAAADFLAKGMLLTVLAAMQVIATDGSGTEPWAVEVLNSLHGDEPDHEEPARVRPHISTE